MGKGGGHDTRGRRENTTKRGELFLGIERDITPQKLLSGRRGVMHGDILGVAHRIANLLQPLPRGFVTFEKLVPDKIVSKEHKHRLHDPTSSIYFHPWNIQSGPSNNLLSDKLF